MTDSSLDIFFVGTLPPHRGGSAHTNLLLVNGFADSGNTVRALAPIAEDATDGASERYGLHRSIDVSRYRVPFYATDPTRPVSDTYQEVEYQALEQGLPRLISESRPDLIFVGRESFLEPTLAALSGMPVPVVVRIAGGMLLGIQRGDYPESAVNRLSACLHEASLIVSPAVHLTNCAANLGGRNIEVIPNPVDLDSFAPRTASRRLRQSIGIGADDIVVAHASNFKPMKRAQDVVLSAKSVLERHPNVVYLMLGDGEDQPKTVELCAKLGLSDRFRFTGWIDRADVPDYLNLAAVVVMPSLYECQARVYLETMASAGVILASDIAGSREVIDDGETGILFECCNHADLAGKTQAIVADADMRRRLGSAARESAQRHNAKLISLAYISAMNNVLRRQQSLGKAPSATDHPPVQRPLS